jgi:beta-glucosidase
LKVSPHDVVTFNVKNTGTRAGTEIAQVYCTLPAAAGEPRRLVGWAKVQLKPGESRSVRVDIEPITISVFDVEHDRWDILGGEYRYAVGGSSRNLPLTVTHLPNLE